MKKFILAFSVIAATVLSCTKASEYSANCFRDADPEITLFENGLTVPADTSMSFKLDEFFKDGSLVKDESGNYFIDTEFPRISHKLSLFPEISVTKLINDYEINRSTGNYSGKSISADVRFVVATVDEGPEMSLEFELPKEVSDIESLGLEFPFSLEVTSSSSMVFLGEGFTFEFPKGFRVEKESSDSWYDIVEEGGVCKAVFDSDVPVTGKLSCGMKLTAIAIQPGWIKDGVVSIKEQVGIRGDFGIQGPGTVPGIAKLSFSSKQGAVKVKNVRLKVDAEIALQQQTIELDIPSEITADGNVFKFNDTGLDVTINNNTPVTLTVSGTIEAVRRDGAVSKPAHFSSISLDAFQSGTVHIDETVCPGVLDILNCMPEQIILRDLLAKCESRDYSDVNVEKEYEAGLSGKIHLPLIFERGTRFQFEKVFENDLDFDASASVSKLGIGLEMQNDLPVDLDASLNLVIDGQHIEIKTEDGSPIKVESGRTSVLKLVAAKPDGTAFVSIGDIEIVAGASVSSDKAVFNDKDELTIRVKSVSAPSGITLKLK